MAAQIRAGAGRGARRGRGNVLPNQSLGPGAALQVRDEGGSQLRAGHRRTSTEDGTPESQFENAGPDIDVATKREESPELTKTGTFVMSCFLQWCRFLISLACSVWWWWPLVIV